MLNSFKYCQPVQTYFGFDKMSELENLLDELKVKKAVLICDPFFKSFGEELMSSNTKIVGIFSDVAPNPLLSGVLECTEIIEKTSADAVIAIGGGSSIDTAKFASACAYSEFTALDHFDGKPFTSNKVKIIAVPTTAGTGSEVTQVSVISHGDQKKTTHNPVFMPTACIVDPKLMMSVPKKVTMETGLDALAHALEGYWSKNHLPITDIFAIESVKLILANLEEAYTSSTEESRVNMAYASLLAGMTFSIPKTAGSHACSFPLSAIHHLSHGEACAFTLDSFVIVNADERLENLAKAVGLADTNELAEKIRYFKKIASLKIKIADLGDDVDLEKIAEQASCHMLMQNNPVEISKEKMLEILENLR